ncbi:MAG TPA: hypothetical protein VGD69_28740 [Herpetosiphonaceae bacterium]
MRTTILKIYNNRTHISDIEITDQQVRDAIEQYDREYPANDYPRTSSRAHIKTWLENQKFDFALRYDGKCYPPKYILHLVIAAEQPGLAAHFYGGGDAGNTNSVLEALGFEVTSKIGCR